MTVEYLLEKNFTTELLRLILPQMFVEVRDFYSFVTKEGV